MDRVTAIATFVRCVERGRFSVGDHELHMAQPTVSKLIASFEKHLGENYSAVPLTTWR